MNLSAWPGRRTIHRQGRLNLHKALRLRVGPPYLIGEAVSFFFCRQSHSPLPACQQHLTQTPNEHFSCSLPYG